MANRRGGGNYEDFAEYIYAYISPMEMQNLDTEFARDKYKTDPDQILEKLDDFFMKKFHTRTGYGNAQNTRDINFQKFLEKNIFSKKKLTYNDGEVDFEPLFSKYYEISGELFPKRPAISERVERTFTALGEVKSRNQYESDIKKIISFRKKQGDSLFDSFGNPLTEENLKRLTNTELKEIWENTHIRRQKPGEFYNQTKNQIENLKRNLPKNVSTLIALRDAMREAALQRPNLQPTDDKKLELLYKQIDNSLKPYENIASKKPRKNNEIIEILSKLSGKPKENFDRDSDKLLKQKLNFWREQIKGKPFFRTVEDLPTSDKKIKELFKENKKKLTKKIQEEAFRKVSERYKEVRAIDPFIADEEIQKETNKRLVANILDTPSMEIEVEKAYLQTKYGNQNIPLKFEDQIKLVKASKTNINKWIKGYKKKTEREIPIEVFEAYKNKNKEKVERANTIVKKANKQELKFLKEAIKGEVPPAAKEYVYDIINDLEF